jgi:hypothetical protein
MTPTNWASLIVAGIAVVTAFAATIRWMVKHYLYELRPNGGGSLKDTVSRLERQVEEIYRLLITSNINDKSN